MRGFVSILISLLFCQVIRADWIVSPNGGETTMTDGNWVLNASVSGEKLTITGVASVNDPTTLQLRSSMKDDEGNFYSLTTIDRYAFNDNKGMTNLVTLTLPDSLKRIMTGAFSGDVRLQNVTPLLPDSITYIGQNAFQNCTSLVGRVRLGFGTDKVGFEYSGQFQKTAIQEVIVGPGVTYIPNSFNGCASLTNVILHDQISSIGSFSGCAKLVSVTPFLPQKCKWVAQQAFFGVPVTNDLTVGYGDEQVQFQGNLCFSKIQSRVIRLGPQVKNLCSAIFSNCSKLEELYLSEGLTSIPNNSLSGCSRLKTIVPFLPSTVTTIGANAFAYCVTLESALYLTNKEPISVNSAYSVQGAFNGCAKIPYANLSGNISALSGGDFYGCKALGEIHFSTNMVHFKGSKNFANCSALTNLFFYGSTVIMTNKAFSGVGNDKIRMWTPKHDEGWTVFQSENVTPLDESMQRRFAAVYPNDRELPLGEWTGDGSGTSIWYFNWLLPSYSVKATRLILR